MEQIEERRKRLTREESRAQTRERLVESAYKLFISDGIEATTVDRIAEEAGYSRGAFYSNFETKEAILAALVDREWRRSEAEFARLEGLETTPQGRVSALRDYALMKATDRKECLLFLELEMYAVRHPEARATIAGYIRRDTELAGRFLDRLFAEFGVTGHPPSELMVTSFIAMAQGLTMRWVVEPEVFSAEAIRESLGLYFDSVITAVVPQLRSSGD